jgi:hypothetical protein
MRRLGERIVSVACGAAFVAFIAAATLPATATGMPASAGATPATTGSASTTGGRRSQGGESAPALPMPTPSPAVTPPPEAAHFRR